MTSKKMDLEPRALRTAKRLRWAYAGLAVVNAWSVAVIISGALTVHFVSIPGTGSWVPLELYVGCRLALSALLAIGAFAVVLRPVRWALLLASAATASFAMEILLSPAPGVPFLLAVGLWALLPAAFRANQPGTVLEETVSTH